MILSLTMIVVGSAVAAVALVLVRRTSPSGGHFANIPAAAGIFSVVGTGFAVLLAFVIFTAFESYVKAREAVGTESVALRQLAATAQFFPAAGEARLEGELICYGRAVVNDEWNTMQRSGESPLVTQWVLRMDQTLLGTPISTEQESAALTNWFDQSQQRQEGRRERLAEAAPSIPNFLWILLFTLVVVVVGYQCLFADPDVPPWSQVVGIVALAATMLSGMVLVWVLDRPFNPRGAAIPPTRIEAVVVSLEQSYGPGAQFLPCDAGGRPTG